MPIPLTGTVPLLFTDIERSTRLAQAYPAHWEFARQRHNAILRAAIDAHNGYIFRVVGDAFRVTFATVSVGIQAALAAQQALLVER